MERRYFRFYGRVQGVGFRYRAYYAAQLLGLTGFVGNLDDGSVELEAQGDPEALDKLVKTIQQTSRWILIDDIVMRTVPTVPRERGFHVESGGRYTY